LFSLAARRLGARVYSFDYDPYSFASTTELRSRYFPEDGEWQVEQGSVLDKDYLESLGQFEYRLFLGCPPPYRVRVAGSGKCDAERQTRRHPLYRNL
jgi:hypothetical protein